MNQRTLKEGMSSGKPKKKDALNYGRNMGFCEGVENGQTYGWNDCLSQYNAWLIEELEWLCGLRWVDTFTREDAKECINDHRKMIDDLIKEIKGE